MNKLGRKKAIVYGLVLVAGLLGLVIDRLGRAEPTPTPGGPPLVPSRNASLAGAAQAATVEGPAIARIFEPMESLPTTEPARTGASSGRDAFRMSMAMRRFYEDVSAEKAAENKQKLEDEQQLRQKQVEQFQATHKLKGTTLAGDQSWALVDDRVVRVGDRVDGFELQQVERYRVMFVKDNLKIVLRLPLP